MHVRLDFPSLDRIKASWQKVLDADPNLKIKLTEMDVPINNIFDGRDKSEYLRNCGRGCPERDKQKARYNSIVKAYLETVPKHRRGGITVWGILDTDTWFFDVEPTIPSWPLLWDGDGRNKPAYDGFKEALS